MLPRLLPRLGLAAMLLLGAATAPAAAQTPTTNSVENALRQAGERIDRDGRRIVVTDDAPISHGTFGARRESLFSRLLEGNVTRAEIMRLIAAILIGIAVMATIATLAMPMLSGDKLDKRMKSVSSERERIRARERERLQASVGKVSLRQQPKAYMKQVVERFNLSHWLGTDQAKKQMMVAGYRGPQAEIAFLFFRLVSPLVSLVLGTLYVFVLTNYDWPITIKIGLAIASAYLGLKAPELFLRNQTTKRQQSMRAAFPDALDLLLICVESGMSIEHACRKVSSEIGVQSIPLAEELTLMTAELSYLQNRREAYDNFALRTGLDAARQITTVLVQAEKYGTPLGTALRVVAQESRDMRLLLAEKKAASLPPKLTVPMIVFFLPVLFVCIMTPAGIQISSQNVF